MIGDLYPSGHVHVRMYTYLHESNFKKPGAHLLQAGVHLDDWLDLSLLHYLLK